MEYRDKITRKMLNLIRETKQVIKENDNSTIVLSKDDSQFGDVRTAQEETFVKTVGENVEFEDNSLMYYPNEKNLKFYGKIPSLNIEFEFSYNETDGCYVTANSIQLTENSYKLIGKIRSAYVNWKKTLLENADLMSRLHKMSTNQ